MPNGVTNKNEKSKSRPVKSNNIQPQQSTKKDKEINSKTNENETNNKSDKKLPDLLTNPELPSDEIDNSSKDNSIEGDKQSAKEPETDLSFFIEDVRGSIKDSTLIDSSSQILPGSAYQKNNRLPKFLQIIDNWMYGKAKNPFSTYQHVTGSQIRRRSPLRILFLILLIISLGYAGFLTGNKIIQSSSTRVIPTITPSPTYVIPFPSSVEFPGGWKILLGVSTSTFPDWKPARAEWFKDTAICKLIAIPWAKQIDAVYKTLEPGEELILTMSNKDETIYQIESLETSLVENIIKKLNRNSPCMIIFLYRENTLTAQLLISSPPIP